MLLLSFVLLVVTMHWFWLFAALLSLTAVFVTGVRRLWRSAP